MSTLQDGITPVSSAEALRAIASQFDGSLDAFVFIEPEPVAAASLAQVHRAVMTGNDGTPQTVAIKLLRPGVVEAVAFEVDYHCPIANYPESYSDMVFLTPWPKIIRKETQQTITLPLKTS